MDSRGITCIAAAFAIMSGLLVASRVSAQTPILQYTFNDTGVTSASTGSNPAALSFLNSSGTATDLHSAGGLGVSGQPSDRAFDNTGSTGMGSNGVGGYASLPANAYGSLISVTYQCWFNAKTPLTAAARLVDENNFVIDAGSSSGTINFYVNKTGPFATSASSAVYSSSNEWVFFAVTYDGTQVSNNVAFYEGTNSTPVTQVGTTQSLDQGAFADQSTLSFGNVYDTNLRPFDGYLDDIRLFGSTTDSSGVLSLGQLETIREADVNNVPEPSTLAILSVAAAACLITFERIGNKKRPSVIRK